MGAKDAGGMMAWRHDGIGEGTVVAWGRQGEGVRLGQEEMTGRAMVVTTEEGHQEKGVDETSDSKAAARLFFVMWVHLAWASAHQCTAMSAAVDGRDW